MTSLSVLTAKRYGAGCALVAGGSGGIGQEICRALARSGADVAFTYHRNRVAGERLAEELRASGRRALAGQVDLRDAGAVKAFTDEARKMLGAVHTSVYAAGPSIPLKYISQLSPEEVSENVGTDLFGCFNLMHATLVDLRGTQGVFISLSTPATRRHAKTDILSGASKVAIEAFVRGLAAEEGRFGVRANVVGVGMITDGIYHELVAKGYFHERYLERAIENVGLRRFGKATDIADAVEFIASDKAGYVSGQVLMVDGGFAV